MSKNSIFIALGLSWLIGCATIPGKTREAQVQTIDELVERTLHDLYRQQPTTKDEIANCLGYVILDNKITKVPVFGAGAGYGVAVDNKTGDRTYLRMSRFDIGGGWGARSVRPVLIFRDGKNFRRFVDGTFKVRAGAEASAKVGNAGVAGGAGKENGSDAQGYSLYMLTDAGVSATFSVALIRVKPIKLRKTNQ